MQTYFKEKIGNPRLFTGRQKEMTDLLNWADRIKRDISQSTAILSRRKTGKTAIMQRLFNIIFNKHDGVIPFYLEIRETDQWLGDFSEKYFLTFVFQFMAYMTRKPEYLDPAFMGNYKKALEVARKEKFDYLVMLVKDIIALQQEEKTDLLWDLIRDSPRSIAAHYDMHILQMIDEFQYINKYIFWDKEKKRRADNLAGSYLHTCEYKNAPMLVSGSWVGWLTRDLQRLLPGRFLFHYLENMPEKETIEMILKYSFLEDIPVTEKTVPLIAGLTEGNPFYIGSLFRSKYAGKDFTTEKGILSTLEYETLHKEGSIKGTWMEYAYYAMDEANDVNAKKMVLYLCKHREREVTRRELKEKLNLKISDSELEKRLKILVKADIIEQGSSNFDYQGVQDNIFDKIFRGVYQKEIQTFETKDITNEYKALSEKLLAKNKSLLGEYSNFKGKFAEYLLIDNLRYQVLKANFKGTLKGLPEDFEFVEYESVWSYSASPVHKKDLQIDILARAEAEEYTLIGEVKNRKAKFSIKEAKIFMKKAQEVMELENINKAVLFVFSINGFHKNALAYLTKNKIAWASQQVWIERSNY